MYYVYHTHSYIPLFVSFRRGLNLPRASLPLVVARACIRLGRPDLMMCFTRDKVKYGVFPSRKVYNIIMDAMLKSQKPKGMSTIGDFSVERRSWVLAFLTKWKSYMCYVRVV